MFKSLKHIRTKKEIKKTIQAFQEFTPDQRANEIFFVWITRGMNLVDLYSAKTNIAARESGMDELITPIYYYKKGSESILHNIAGEFDQMGNYNIGNALLFHFYTNMHPSFPEEDYLPLIRSMWDEMFESLIDKTDMNEKVNFALPKVTQNEIQKKQFLEHNDIKPEDFIEDPKSIMPHFLVPDHPLSKRLLEEEKLMKQLGFDKF